MAHKRSTSKSAAKSAAKPAGASGSTGGRTTTANAARAATNSPASAAPKQRAGGGAQPSRSAQVATKASTQRAPGAAQAEAPRPLSFSELFRAHPWMFGTVIVALLAIGVYAIATGLNPSPTPLAVGKAAPNFALTATDGKQYSLSNYRGKVVLLEFFAPWCPHCRNQVSVLNQVAKTYAGQEVQVLSVTDTPYGYNYESSGDTSPITMNDVTKFVNNYHVSYPAMLDTSMKAGNAYGVAAFPQMYVIDRNGTITWNNGSGGESAYKDLQSAIERAQAVPLQTATSTVPAATATATPAK